ncbi:MAG: type II toxin-antitoxin system RelE/ParE family toxin [Coleofasciculaceae cyanobacterium]
MREIIFYQNPSGRCPVEDYLDSLSGKQVQKVVWVLQIIEELEVVPTKFFKKLVNTDDIWEVRIQLGNNIFRLLGFIEDEQLVILTNGFTKKAQKTPKNEIELAEQRKKEYLSRKESENE